MGLTKSDLALEWKVAGNFRIFLTAVQCKKSFNPHAVFKGRSLTCF